MPDDSIVAEVRLQRELLLEQAGGSLGTLVQFLRRRENEAGRQPVRLTPKEPLAGPRPG